MRTMLENKWGNRKASCLKTAGIKRSSPFSEYNPQPLLLYPQPASIKYINIVKCQNLTWEDLQTSIWPAFSSISRTTYQICWKLCMIVFLLKHAGPCQYRKPRMSSLIVKTCLNFYSIAKHGEPSVDLIETKFEGYSEKKDNLLCTFDVDDRVITNHIKCFEGLWSKVSIINKMIIGVRLLKLSQYCFGVLEYKWMRLPERCIFQSIMVNSDQQNRLRVITLKAVHYDACHKVRHSLVQTNQLLLSRTWTSS